MLSFSIDQLGTKASHVAYPQFRLEMNSSSPCEYDSSKSPDAIGDEVNTDTARNVFVIPHRLSWSVPKLEKQLARCALGSCRSPGASLAKITAPTDVVV